MIMIDASTVMAFEFDFSWLNRSSRKKESPDESQGCLIH
jgi:hypothetical protein